MRWTDSHGAPVLDGVKINIEKVNNSTVAVLLTDQAGHQVKVCQNGYSSLQVCWPAPPKKAKRYVLAGKYLGLAEVREEFESEREADARRREYQDRADGNEEIGLTVTMVEVEVAE